MRRRHVRRLGHVRGRVAGPNPVHMTPGEINKEMSSLEKMNKDIIDEMIAAGRGHEPASETLKKSPLEDPLTMMYHAVSRRRWALQAEKERRMGGKWYGDLPKHAKPIRGW